MSGCIICFYCNGGECGRIWSNFDQSFGELGFGPCIGVVVSYPLLGGGDWVSGRKDAGFGSNYAGLIDRVDQVKIGVS